STKTAWSWFATACGISSTCAPPRSSRSRRRRCTTRSREQGGATSPKRTSGVSRPRSAVCAAIWALPDSAHRARATMRGFRYMLAALMAHGSSKAVIAALAANLGIALAKFVGFALTGAASMLAEAVHSCADSGNQALLLLGLSRGRLHENDEHPFGYGA